MAAQKHNPGDPIVIKKYANRRLYNTAKSSYVTLEDLSQMVQNGEDFQVFDAKSGEDITRSVLAQIIFEQEAKGQNMLPTNFLRQLIRLYGDALQSVVPGYLDASMETFTKNQERLREAFGQNPAMSHFEQLARSNIEWAERAMRMWSPLAMPGAGGPSESAPPPQSAPPPEQKPAQAEGVGEDLEALQRQLAEMRSQLEALTEPARSGTGKTGPGKTAAGKTGASSTGSTGKTTKA